MQKELLNKEIKNILYGFADCLMYKTGQVSPAGMLFPQNVDSCKDDIENSRLFYSFFTVFQIMNLGPQLLHGQILGIFGLPGSLPVPLLQGELTILKLI